MHELGVTQEILNIAVTKAKESNSQKILQINLVIGDASSIIDDCVQFCFDFVSKNTIAEGARLNFQRMPLQMKCRKCGKVFNPEKEEWVCPRCKEWDAELVGGTEFYMDSIEVDE